MKTNQILLSEDRNLFGVPVRQKTEDSFLSVTDLYKAYEVARWQYGWKGHTINQLMQTKQFAERCYHLLYELDLIKVDIPSFMEMVDREGITNVLKGLRVYQNKGRGSNKSVWTNPYIWVSIALELNPILYAKVVTWLTDSLIFDRIEAGSNYKPMNIKVASIIKSPNYIEIAKQINIRVFGRHESGMRNLASKDQLRMIAEIEKYISKCIERGFVKTEEDVIREIQNF